MHAKSDMEGHGLAAELSLRPTDKQTMHGLFCTHESIISGQASCICRGVLV